MSNPGIMDSQEELRNEYRKLLEKVALKKEEADDLPQEKGVPVFRELMKKADELYSNVETTRDCILDAKVVNQISGLCRHQAETLSTNARAFNPSEYASKLIRKMCGEVELGGGEVGDDAAGGDARKLTAKHWRKLGLEVNGLFGLAPALHYLNGALEKQMGQVEEKQKKIRRARRKPGDTSELIATQATQLITGEKSENQTEILVHSTFKQLLKEFKNRGRKPIDYFEFVLHPTSYGETIENMFHVSFLVKERKVQIELESEDEVPVIFPIGKKTESDDLEEEVIQKQQVIATMDMAEWEDLVKNLNITEPMIKHDQASSPQRRKKAKT